MLIPRFLRDACRLYSFWCIYIFLFRLRPYIGLAYGRWGWLDLTWLDLTWLDVTWLDVTWRDLTWRDVTWRDATRRDATGRDGTWRDVTWRDVTWLDLTWLDLTWLDLTWLDLTWLPNDQVSCRCRLMTLAKNCSVPYILNFTKENWFMMFFLYNPIQVSQKGTEDKWRHLLISQKGKEKWTMSKFLLTLFNLFLIGICARNDVLHIIFPLPPFQFPPVVPSVPPQCLRVGNPTPSNIYCTSCSSSFSSFSFS